MEKAVIVADRNNKSECFPIDDYNDVLKWTPPPSSWAELVKPLNKRADFCLGEYPVCGMLSTEIHSRVPKTLVCHDMNGGYLNDRFTNGHSSVEDYKFLYWPCIDIFVYFSHHFLTIPPLSWINAGHLHGVKVLGTLITEGEKGAQDWKEICSNKRMLRKLVRNIALIAKHYNFDGYLLNVENVLKVDHVKEPFMYFIRILYNELKDIKADNLLIWYDAVTNFGFLQWQNCLNEYNRDFFNACDGIYLNYGWDEELLKDSALCASARVSDVYVGIDVFGRGVFGGGGFTTYKAFELIRKYNLSAAIFAPGWVHEKCEDGENVNSRDFSFWSYISQYLFTYGPSQLPFHTSFCRGYGYKTFKQGLVESNEAWFDQSKMNHLPTQLCGIEGVEDNCCFSYYEKDGFSGGGSLLITQKLRKAIFLDHRDCILICDFSTTPGATVCFETYTKPLIETESYGMNLIVTTTKVEKNKIVIDADKTIHKLHVRNNEESVNTWYKSKFELTLGNEHIITVGCELTGICRPVLLGSLKIYSV